MAPHQQRFLAQMSCAAFACLCLLPWLARAQDASPAPAPQPPPQPAQQGEGPVRVEMRLADLPPPVRLGARVELVRQRISVLPEVVVVPDARSALQAISGWSLQARYPVLIDDGSGDARETIARFVRAYQPQRVLRLTQSIGPEFADGATLRDSSLAAVASAWRLDQLDTQALTVGDRFARAQHVPVGVVVADEKDGGWIAAVALAAGRGQVLAFADLPPTPDTPIGAAEMVRIAHTVTEALEQAIVGDRALAENPPPWRGVGEGIDGLTLCANMPVRFERIAGSFEAISDTIGRDLAQREGDSGPGLVVGPRWAWAGQISGTSAQSLARAMSGLFLQPTRAWLVDTYPKSPPWSQYALASVAEVLGKASIASDLLVDPRATLVQLWTRPSVDAGLVFINSKGESWNFDLSGSAGMVDRGRPGDLPLMRAPGIAYVVHSYSCEWPHQRGTFAGRLLERGCYAVFGSVHEPTLGAFLPPGAVVLRWLAPAPLGAAARADEGSDNPNNAKLAMLGDPLLTLGPAAPRAQGTLLGAAGAGQGALVDVADGLEASLRAEQFGSAVRSLVLLGRDDDALRLGQALLRERPAKLEAQAAEALMHAAVRSSKHALAVELFRTLPMEMAELPMSRDVLWLAIGPDMADGQVEPALIELLRRHRRTDMIDRDSAEIVRLIKRDSGLASASRAAAEMRAQLPTDGWRSRFDQALGRLLDDRRSPAR